MEDKDIILEETESEENAEIEEETDEEEEEFELSNEAKKVIKIAVIEAIVLIVLLFVCRLWVFPPMARVSELHTQIAMECVGISLTATLFSAFAITFRKVWKTHGIYIILPVIFLVFASILLMLTNEINFA